MPTATRGNICWCDFGPVIGNELSGRRPALIISNTELNRRLSVTTVLPMSRTAPSARHLPNHVFIEAANSWASVRQAKSVDQTALGPHFATATSQEMERALEIIVARLSSIRNRPGIVQTPEGNKLIFPGSVWETESSDQHHQFPAQQLLVLDYNRGNQIAMAVAMDFRHITNSPVRISVQLEGRAQTASALIHRVSSIDIGQRTIRNTGTVVLDSLARVNSALLAAIDV